MRQYKTPLSGSEEHIYDASPAPDYINNAVLMANQHKVFTVPSGAKVVSFGCEASIWVRWGIGFEAAIPTADITDGTGSERLPPARGVNEGDQFSVISKVNQIISLTYYA